MDEVTLTRLQLSELADEYPKLEPVLKKASRLLASVTPPDAGVDQCERCRGPIEQPETGRPRKYCLDCNPRRRPRKTLQNANLAA